MQRLAGGAVENSERHYVTLVSLFSAGIFGHVGAIGSFFFQSCVTLHVFLADLRTGYFFDIYIYRYN